MEELKRIIDDSEITKEDDALWPPPDRVGRQVGSGLGFFFSIVQRSRRMNCSLQRNVFVCRNWRSSSVMSTFHSQLLKSVP